MVYYKKRSCNTKTIHQDRQTLYLENHDLHYLLPSNSLRPTFQKSSGPINLYTIHSFNIKYNFDKPSYSIIKYLWWHNDRFVNKVKCATSIIHSKISKDFYSYSIIFYGFISNSLNPSMPICHLKIDNDINYRVTTNREIQFNS